MTSVLILVDLQRDYLSADDLQPPADTLIAATQLLLHACRARRLPILHVWTTIDPANDRRLHHWRREDRWSCVAGTPGHEPPAPLRPRDGEPTIHKTGYNAFEDPVLAATLSALGCDHIILAGVHLHACVRTTAGECLARNLRVTVAADAVASHDPIHAAATRRWLAERGVRFASTDAILLALDGREPDHLVLRSPRDLTQTLFEVTDADDAQIARAVDTAAHFQLAWQCTPHAERAVALTRLAAQLESGTDAWARQMALEIGKPIRHAREEVRRAAANVRDILRCAAPHDAPIPPGPAAVRHRPLGVVAVITPWNNPLAIPLGKIAAALAYGNTVVCKPSPAGTRLAQRLLDELTSAGLPSGAVEMLTGDHLTAQRLAMHPRVDAVTFTGSNLAGCAMQEICARRIIPLQAELGGNNAAIVCPDADLDHAAAQIAHGAFDFAGQRCTANRRAIVSGDIYETFLPKLEAATARLAWGDPLDDATDIGPLITAAHRDRLLAALDRARDRAAASRTLVPHDQTPADRPWRQLGAYMPPHIVSCDDPADVLVQQEMMGPVLVLQRARDFDHALDLCNGVRHGLAAAIFTRRHDLQDRFRDQARAGILKINASTAGVDVALPFGGWKASGIGPPEHGPGDKLFYTRMQALYTHDAP
ncbi:MAG: aldehyde dehydrogenase family protein [Phycisphaeraceae bacterium]|nr:aldehyde dehydrogenase family protein [Phycisphaeraceae bacterium]